MTTTTKGVLISGGILVVIIIIVLYMKNKATTAASAATTAAAQAAAPVVSTNTGGAPVMVSPAPYSPALTGLPTSVVAPTAPGLPPVTSPLIPPVITPAVPGTGPVTGGFTAIPLISPKVPVLPPAATPVVSTTTGFVKASSAIAGAAAMKSVGISAAGVHMVATPGGIVASPAYTAPTPVVKTTGKPVFTGGFAGGTARP